MSALIDWPEALRRGDPAEAVRAPWHANRRMCTCKTPIVRTEQRGVCGIVTLVILNMGEASRPHAADCERLR